MNVAYVYLRWINDFLIIDHLDKLQIPGQEEEQHYDSLMALARLGEGLFWAYDTVLQMEQRARKDATLENIKMTLVGGLLDNMPLGVLSCAFQWYAVSACNYAQLVGWLSTGQSNSAKEYARRVLPTLTRYRNKVAAHFAIVDPRRDNEADLAASVMTQIVFVEGRLYTAALTPVIMEGESEIEVSVDLSWSLTRAHEHLIQRYWPTGRPRAYQSLKVPPGKTTFMLSLPDSEGSGT